MKKVTTEIVCDVCGVQSDEIDDMKYENQHSATLEFNFGYGSNIDGLQAELHFCAKDAEELLEMVQKRWPKLIPVDRQYYGER